MQWLLIIKFGVAVLSKINLWFGYYQLKVKNEDVLKTTFQTRYRYYEFLEMPFGLTNAPTRFIDLINRVFQPFFDRFVIVFIDDISVYSKTIEDHKEYLRVVFQTLQERKLYAKFKKYEFWLDWVIFLGHVVIKEGIFVDLAKVEALVNWPKPINVADIRYVWLVIIDISWIYSLISQLH